MKPDCVWRAVAVGVVAWGLAGAAHAQDYNQPPADVPMAEDPQSETGALALRISRLEEKLRSANGQIEELQNQNRKLSEDLRRFKEDVEFRLQGKSGQAGPLPAPAPTDIASAPAKPQRKPDAFDPAAQPNAPGAPKPLGSTAPSAPLNLPSHLQRDETGGLKPLPTPVPEPKKADEGEPTFVAGSVPFSDSKEQFKSAVAAYKAGQYADAEALFKAYLEANKGVSNAPDAIFYIGETYMQRGRPREAAEQYLKVSTDYPKSARAPESMVRLGLALAKLGNNDQACATFAEVGKRYPSASAKKSADREAKAQRCT